MMRSCPIGSLANQWISGQLQPLRQDSAQPDLWCHVKEERPWWSGQKYFAKWLCGILRLMDIFLNRKTEKQEWQMPQWKRNINSNCMTREIQTLFHTMCRGCSTWTQSLVDPCDLMTVVSSSRCCPFCCCIRRVFCSLETSKTQIVFRTKETKSYRHV